MKNSHLMTSTGTLLAVIMLAGGLVQFGTANALPNHSSFGTFVNAGSVPYGAKLVLNISYKVTNDEDSGFSGYWALDNYNKRVQVWQDPSIPTKYYVVARYVGNWNTFAGASSPGAGIIEPSDGSGTLQGGWSGTFTASGISSSASYPTFGNIGSFDLGGTKADILLGTYGNGQTGPTTVFDWLSTYFPGYTNLDQSQWGWTYHYHGQSWNNFYDCMQSGGATPCPGDIVT